MFFYACHRNACEKRGTVKPCGRKPIKISLSYNERISIYSKPAWQRGSRTVIRILFRCTCMSELQHSPIPFLFFFWDNLFVSDLTAKYMRDHIKAMIVYVSTKIHSLFH